MTDEILLTRDGYSKIELELEQMVTEGRKDIAARMKEAISYGDISENAEYDAAKNDQAELEEKINKYEDILRKAVIIEEEDISFDQVNVGVKVKVKDLEFNEIVDYTIVGATEADPFECRISNESPLGSGLLGKKTGEVVDILAPAGIVRYEILEIHK